MPVKLWSGLPGHGKTATMVAEMVKSKEQHPERPIFAINIEGLHESVATPLTFAELERWRELPPGSIICIDECQDEDFMPQDRGQPKHWVREISRVRHEGMDFWLTTQHPNNMSAFVRRLIDDHIHCVRKFNSNVISRWRWPRCMDNCEKASAQKTATHEFGALPSHVFDLYKSSNMHTMKRRFPLKLLILPAALVAGVAALCLVPYAWHHLRDSGNPNAHASPSIFGKHETKKEEDNADNQLRRADYSKWMAPRVDGIPWSSPAFDGLAVKAEPRLFCIASEKDCLCETEQGTKYQVEARTCRMIVENGSYNPFQAPRDDARADRTEKRDEDRQEAAKPPADPHTDVAQADAPDSSAVAWKASAMRGDYSPPELVRQPDAIKSGTGM